MSQPRALRLLATLCVTVVLFFQLCETAQGKVTCQSSLDCKPYSAAGPPCERHRNINLRFMLQTCRENSFIDNGVHNLATYSFCSTVDRLSSFTLTGAPFLATSFQTTSSANNEVQYHLSENLEPRYLSVYGFGASSNVTHPQVGSSSGAVLIAMKDSAPGIGNSVGIVTMLSLEIGLHNGFFNYIGLVPPTERTVPNPNYDPSKCTTPPVNPNPIPSPGSINYCDKEIVAKIDGTVVQPAKVGFVPTCNVNDECMMGDPTVFKCIGQVSGKKNCGVYTNDLQEIRNLKVTILVSYYGTDSKKRVLTSGGANPLNFMNFAGTNALQDIGNKFNNLFDGGIPFDPP